MEYIYFNSRDELLRLRITEIAYFESDGNYCNVVTANKLRSPIGMNLTNLEHALDKQLGNETTTFIRIGKRFIVNKRYICKVNIPSSDWSSPTTTASPSSYLSRATRSSNSRRSSHYPLKRNKKPCKSSSDATPKPRN